MININYLLTYRPFLIILFVINLFGTIYGYIWYKSQLVITPTHFLPFVPDSPTASLFFTIFLLFFIFKRHVPYIEALALMTLFKYGIWAVIMNILTLFIDGGLDWQGYMLIASHGAMAIQGLLYAPYYKFKWRHFIFASLFIMHDVIIDYVFEMMPIYGSLTIYMKEIGYFTFWLTLITIYVSYYVTLRNENNFK